jgi:hypothetical protein
MTREAGPAVPRLRPPFDQTRKQLEGGARHIATLLARRGHHVKRIEEIESELAQARRFLRDLIRDVSAPVEEAPQTHLDELE